MLADTQTKVHMSEDKCRVERQKNSRCNKGGSERALASDGGMSSLGEVLEALTHPTRRRLLYYLQDTEVATVEELAREVAAAETDAPPDAIPADQAERVAADLTHNHLPKLTAARFVEYDSRSRTVRYTHPPDLLETVLRLIRNLEEGHDE